MPKIIIYKPWLTRVLLDAGLDSHFHPSRSQRPSLEAGEPHQENPEPLSHTGVILDKVPPFTVPLSADSNIMAQSGVHDNRRAYARLVNSDNAYCVNKITMKEIVLCSGVFRRGYFGVAQPAFRTGSSPLVGLPSELQRYFWQPLQLLRDNCGGRWWTIAVQNSAADFHRVMAA